MSVLALNIITKLMFTEEEGMEIEEGRGKKRERVARKRRGRSWTRPPRPPHSGLFYYLFLQSFFPILWIILGNSLLAIQVGLATI